MECRTRWTRRICKLVSPLRSLRSSALADLAELDALGLEDEAIGEGETPSYLQDATALPDFIDSAPIEETSVRVSLQFHYALADLAQQPNGPTAEVAR